MYILKDFGLFILVFGAVMVISGYFWEWERAEALPWWVLTASGVLVWGIGRIIEIFKK